MPDIKNVTRQVQSVSPYTSSTNSSLLQNNVDTSLNGTSATLQEISEVSLDTQDFGDINQSQKQDGFFVSVTDKAPLYAIPQNILDQNEIKRLEEDVGVPYSFLSQTVAQQKATQVKNDFLPKNKTFSLNESSTSNKIDTINSEYGYSKDENGRYKRNVNTKFDYISRMKGYTTHRGTSKDVSGEFKTDTMSYSVIIEEAREATRSYSEDINNEGFFSAASKEVGLQSLVTIKILSNVQSFNFGTSQNFDPIEPRGSQSPLYFYKNNPGRTLGFSAEFYQQEYPKEPLLSIAEKAQYLARPYRHGDYSVIPKLVKVTIPGRSFRGYLTNVSVNYSADMGDYRTWDRGKVLSALDSASTETVSGRILRDNDKTNIETEVKGLVGGNYNTAETMNYGLGKMTIDFNLAIVEEIRLTVYETAAEVQAREDALRREMEQKQIDDQLAEAAQFLYTYKYKAAPSDLILVDKDGKFVTTIYNPEDGSILAEEDWPAGCITLAEWEQEEKLKEAYRMNNNQTSSATYYSTDEDVMNNNLTMLSKENLIDLIINDKKKINPYMTPEQENQIREEYKSKTMVQVAEEYKTNVLAKECNDEDKSKFLLLNTEVIQTKDTSILNISVPEALKYFLCTPINTIKDVQNILMQMDAHKGLDAEIDIQQIENWGIDDRWDEKVIIELCCEDGLGLNMKDFIENPPVNPYGLGYCSSLGVSTSKTCGFVIDNRLSFSSDPEKDAMYKILFRKGSSSARGKGVWTFQRICTDWPEGDFIISVDEYGNKLPKQDTTIRDYVINSIKAVRDAFYKGFNKRCSEIVTENGAKIFSSRQECERYMKESGVSISYYWDYDGPAAIKGNNPSK